MLFLKTTKPISLIKTNLFKETLINNEFLDTLKKTGLQPKVIKQLHSLEEIEHIRKNDRYKYISRNLLGVRKHDDWINNLEIGNVMHLNPLSTSAFLINVGKHYEFQKDPMLKKLVLLVVALFSIATEMRMIVPF